jgi:hypothetical protein
LQHSLRSSRLFACALGLAAAAACSEREDPLRNFGLVPNIVDSTAIRTTVISTSDLDTFFQTTRNSGSRLWVGSDSEAGEPTEAKALLRFGNVSVPAGATVLADTLRLFCDFHGDYEDPTNQSIAVERINSGSWLTEPTLGWPFTSHEPLNPPVLATVGACPDTPNTLVTVILPANLVAAWAAAPDSNFGLALVASGPGAFKRFVSSGSVAPALGVRYETGTTAAAETTRVRFGLTEHTTLTLLSTAVAGGTGGESFALVGGAFDYRGILRFDLSSLPDQASIHQLKLTLRLDPGSAFLGEDSTRVTIGVHEVVDLPGENLDARPVVGFVTAPAVTAVVDAAADTSVTIAITPLARAIDRGILFKVDRDFPALIRFGFVTREGAADHRPRLEVLYSLPAKIRL